MSDKPNPYSKFSSEPVPDNTSTEESLKTTVYNQLIGHSHLLKACESCDELVGVEYANCYHCNAYNFNKDPEYVLARLKHILKEEGHLTT